MSWPRPVIEDYSEYRDYLRACYEAASKHNRKYSYRYFASRAGYRAPNWFKRVIDGELNLNARGVDGLTRALGLRAREARFLGLMTTFEHGRTPAARDAAFRRMIAYRRFAETHDESKALYKYLSNWLLPAIREMAELPGFKSTTAWIHRRLRPRQSRAAVESAIATLFKLKLLRRTDSGRVVAGERRWIATGHEVRALAAANYHRRMLKLAQDSIDGFSADERHLNAMTLALPASRLPLLKERINAFVEALSNEQTDEIPDTVYQIEIALYPLSEPGAGR